VPKKRIVLRGVNFDFDKAEIRPQDSVVLDAGAEVLNENPEVQVEVAGHTDSTGPETYNQGLSEARARAAVDYLVEKGVDRERLRPVGYGETQPVADNGTSEGRAENRRVEFVIR
jgi:OOP family OmpA-OmpF porin